jgi:hypothetical protein
MLSYLITLVVLYYLCMLIDDTNLMYKQTISVYDLPRNDNYFIPTVDLRKPEKMRDISYDKQKPINRLID